MNMKGGASIPFTAEIAYLGDRDRKNLVLQRWCKLVLRIVLSEHCSVLS